MVFAAHRDAHAVVKRDPVFGLAAKILDVADRAAKAPVCASGRDARLFGPEHHRHLAALCIGRQGRTGKPDAVGNMVGGGAAGGKTAFGCDEPCSDHKSRSVAGYGFGQFAL